MRCTVGVFDSGIGGLSVVAALLRMRPALPVRYIADTAYFPYGDRPEPEVDERAFELSRQLLDEGCRLLVVACNTASSSSLDSLRARLNAPIVGMEPPLKPAAERTRSGRVAVLVTAATASGGRLARLSEAHARGRSVTTIPLPGLADMVEAGEVSGPRVEARLRAALAGLAGDGVDEVALGCTHYAFLRPELERLLGPGIEVIDAAEPVARRIVQQLEAHSIPIPEGEPVPVVCSATGDPDAFEASLARLQAAGAELPPLRVIRGALA